MSMVYYQSGFMPSTAKPEAMPRRMLSEVVHEKLGAGQERHIPMISLLNGALESIIGPIYKYAAPTALGLLWAECQLQDPL